MKKQSVFLGAILLPLFSLAATYVVTNIGDSGAGSFRQAILDANANPGLDYIHFNIPGAGPHVIQPLTQLPYTEGPTVFDAYTQPGALPATASSAAVIKIELDGSLIPGFQGQTNCPICIAHDCTVKGFAIHDFGSGILVEGNGNVMRGNYVGLDASGTNAPGNKTDGLVINGSSNTIGGSAPADRNVVAGHAEQGLVIFPNTSGNLVQGNYFGTNAAGNAALPNIHDNIGIGGSSNTIAGNLVCGSATGHGISLVLWNSTSSPPSSNLVQGNSIGIGADGASAIPNFVGILLLEAVDNTITGNLIAGNTGDAVQLHPTGTTGNRISQNSIFGNGGLAVDLDGNGVTPNDPGDGDNGANDLLNFPVITSAKTTPGKLTVKGEIDTPNPSAVTVEVYANPVPTPGGDPSGHGEGKIYLGAAAVNAQGKFTVNLPSVAAGTLISAIAIDGASNTSEFAANVAASPPGNYSLVPNSISALEVFPNPFQSSVFIAYPLSEDGQVRLSVNRADGQEAAVLVNEFQQAGLHRVEFRGGDLAAGVYFYRLETGEGVRSGKLILQL